MDTARVTRWSGDEPDLSRPLPSDLVLAAATVDPEVRAGIGAYLGMVGGPDSLDPVRDAARRVYETGWRAPLSPGPSRPDSPYRPDSPTRSSPSQPRQPSPTR